MRLRELYEYGRIVKGVNTTDDVDVNSISKEAKKFGFDVDKDGTPPTLSKKVKGKSTNVLFNLGLAESIDLRNSLKPGKYKHKKENITIEVNKDSSVSFITPQEWEIEGDSEYLEYVERMLSDIGQWQGLKDFAESLGESVAIKFERGDDYDVLHIKEKGKNRVEVRGKKGYESGNYDSKDKLHKLLDKLKKAANISELMNGETVVINPKHPDGPGAIDATTKEGEKIPNPKNTFLAKADTAYDHYKIGTNLANLKSVPKGANYDEPDIMITPYAGAKEMKYLRKQLQRIGYKTQDAAGHKDAQFDDDEVEENFADGKKKGKSRPGRVKKSGASCNGSVTALRKRAKNASGEKAKMYHWCANMKSGRKKK